MSQKNHLNNSYYQSLTRNIILIIIVVSFTPMIMVSSFMLHQFHASYEEKLHAHLGELVLKHKQNIDTFLTERLRNIRSLGALFTFEQFSDEAFLRERLRMFKEAYGSIFEDLGLINDLGFQVAYAGPFRLEHADYSKAKWFTQAIESKYEYFISDVFLGLRGKPHFVVSVRRQSNGRSWILRATIDFHAFNSLVENLRIGETGFAFILNRSGELQTKPFFKLSSPSSQIQTYLKNGRRNPNSVYMAMEKDEKSNENIYVGTYLKDENWLLVYQQNIEDALLDFKHAKRVVIFILIIGGFAILLTAVLLSRRLVSRIATADEEKEMMNQQVIETGKLASVGELAAGIAHEINNPVAIMVEEAGWIGDLLEEETFGNKDNFQEIERALKQINTQGKRCKDITHKLLSFARKTDSRIKEVQLNDLIEEVIGLSAQRAKYDNVEIQTHYDENLPDVCMSPTEVQQVMLNLINNAIHAMENKGGTINVTTRMNEQNIFIEIADTGPGIPLANLPRIFDPFFTTKPVGKGSGLGLSICYGIIKKMRGDIDVESSVGEGTTFCIRLPLQENACVCDLPAKSSSENQNISQTENISKKEDTGQIKHDPKSKAL